LPDDEEVLYCLICGHSNVPDSDACTKCGTPFFRKEFDDYFEHIGRQVPEARSHKEKLAIASLFLVPGVNQRGARDLFKMGFKNFSDLVGATLKEDHRKHGLHRIIARRILLAKMEEHQVHEVTIDYTNLVRCVACHILMPKAIEACAVCGSEQPEEGEAIPGDIQERAGDLIHKLADLSEVERLSDDDIEELSAIFGEVDMKDIEVDKEELEDVGLRMDAFGEIGLLEEHDPNAPPDMKKYRCQIDAWHGAGFDVTEIEKVLEEDPWNFIRQAAPIIQAQLVIRRMRVPKARKN